MNLLRKRKRKKWIIPEYSAFSNRLLRFFTLKTANFKTGFNNQAKNTGVSSTSFLRKNMAGGYYFETDPRNVVFLHDLSVKTQYNRQLRNSLTVNSMNEVLAKIYNTNFKYNRTVGRTGSSAAQNISDARKLIWEYKRENGVELSYNIDQHISRSLAASPSKTNNKKQTWKFIYPFKEDGPKLTFSNSRQANRNLMSGNASKVIQSDVKLDIPINEKFELNAAYQFLENRNKPAVANETKNKKTTRSLGLSYLIADGTKISYLFNVSNSRTFSTVFTNYDTTNRDLRFEWAISRRIRFRVGNATTFDQSSGKTAVRSANLVYDHKGFNILPGTTTIDTRKQFTSAAGNSNTNYTLSVSTPLSYLKGRLTASLQNTFSSQHALTTNQRNNSVNQSLRTNFKVTKRITGSSIINKVKNNSSTPVALSAISVNNIRTDLMSIDLGKKLSFLDQIVNTKYILSTNRNAMRTEVPTPGLTMTKVKKHTLSFTLKGKAWSGNYGLDRASSSSSLGQTQRILTHKTSLKFNDVFGFTLNTNYSTSLTSNGSQVSALVKVTRKYGEKSSFFFNYEILKNKDRITASNNTRNRFMELGYESSI